MSNNVTLHVSYNSGKYSYKIEDNKNNIINLLNFDSTINDYSMHINKVLFDLSVIIIYKNEYPKLKVNKIRELQKDNVLKIYGDKYAVVEQNIIYGRKNMICVSYLVDSKLMNDLKKVNNKVKYKVKLIKQNLLNKNCNFLFINNDIIVFYRGYEIILNDVIHQTNKNSYLKEIDKIIKLCYFYNDFNEILIKIDINLDKVKKDELLKYLIEGIDGHNKIEEV